MNKTQRRLLDDAALLTKQGYEVMAVFIQGSQNYNLEYEGSDIDTKAIILPNFQDLVTAAHPTSYVHILDSNEHVDVKDIRVMFQNWQKQNPNFVEVLFSKHAWVNEKYADLVSQLFDKREDIAHMDPAVMMNALIGMMRQKHKALCHPYPACVDQIELYGYSPKQLHHIVRLKDFMERYAAGESFQDTLIANNREYLISLKRLPPLLGKDEAIKLAEETVAWADKFNKDYQAAHPKTGETMNDVFNAVLTESLRRFYSSQWGIENERPDIEIET